MLYTLKIKLHPTAEQKAAILKTMERFNSACNFISKFAFENKIFGKVKLQQEIYYQVREQFKLSAQMAVRAIGKVAESYANKETRAKLHEFKPRGAMVYDQRNQADLCLVGNIFYLLLVVELPDIPESIRTEFLGIDLGIVKIATTSDGKYFLGAAVKNIRKRNFKLRQELSAWAFYQLRQFIQYKARAAGVPVVLVDPRNASRTCSHCGHVDKANRKSQAKFVCVKCGHSANADINAAMNIARRGAAVIQPNAVA